MAARSDPGPPSAVVVTVNVTAAPATRAGPKRPGTATMTAATMVIRRPIGRLHPWVFLRFSATGAVLSIPG
jgi:hypothetical protein